MRARRGGGAAWYRFGVSAIAAAGAAALAALAGCGTAERQQYLMARDAAVWPGTDQTVDRPRVMFAGGPERKPVP